MVPQFPGKKAVIGQADSDWLVPFYPTERTTDYWGHTKEFGYSYEGLEDEVPETTSTAEPTPEPTTPFDEGKVTELVKKSVNHAELTMLR